MIFMPLPVFFRFHILQETRNGIKYLLWNKTPKDALYINILPTPKFLSDYSDDFVYAMVICQKSDENFAYYYDDFNFILSEDGEFGEEEITKLKNWNDWSQNLDYSKNGKSTK